MVDRSHNSERSHREGDRCWVVNSITPCLENWLKSSKIDYLHIDDLTDIEVDEEDRHHLLFSGALEPRISSRRFSKFIDEIKSLSGWDLVILDECSDGGLVWDTIQEYTMINTHERFSAHQISAILVTNNGLKKLKAHQPMAVIRPHQPLISKHIEETALPFSVYIIVLLSVIVLLYLVTKRDPRK